MKIEIHESKNVHVSVTPPEPKFGWLILLQKLVRWIKRLALADGD